jgi:hypothetical protein
LLDQLLDCEGEQRPAVRVDPLQVVDNDDERRMGTRCRQQVDDAAEKPRLYGRRKAGQPAPGRRTA